MLASRVSNRSFAPIPQSEGRSVNRIRTLRYFLISIALAATFFSNVPTSLAQDRPIALRSDTELSAANKAEYTRVAGLYKVEADVAKRTALRNQLISLTIAQTDLNFISYQKKSRHRRAVLDTLLDILEIGTATAITLTNGERARTVISEALGFLQLSRQAVNKNFSLKDTQILFNKMVAKRAEVQTKILKKFGQDDTQYSFATAMIELIEYYRAGTIDGALDNLGIDTGAEAQQKLDELEGVQLSPPATKADAVLAKTASDTLFDIRDQLQDQDAAKAQAALDRLKAIVTELEKDPELTPFLTAAGLSSQRNDGPALRLGLLNVRRALRSLKPPRFDLLTKIDNVIIQ